MGHIVVVDNIFSHRVPLAPVRWDANHYCTAAALTPEEAALFGVFPLVGAPRPECNPLTHKVVELDPALVDGAWTQQWGVVDLPDDVVAANLLAAEERRIASLWQAAHDVEFAAISGSAIGLITLGVLQGKPKAIAVQAWIQSLWSSYYERKFGGSTDTDFTAFVCPHSVPELMQELGV